MSITARTVGGSWKQLGNEGIYRLCLTAVGVVEGASVFVRGGHHFPRIMLMRRWREGLSGSGEKEQTQI